MSLYFLQRVSCETYGVPLSHDVMYKVLPTPPYQPHHQHHHHCHRELINSANSQWKFFTIIILFEIGSVKNQIHPRVSHSLCLHVALP